MEQIRRRIFYFSPTGSCKAIAQAVALPHDELLDLTAPDSRAKIPIFSPTDECVFVFPVYNGAIPEACAAFLEKCEGNGAHAFLFCVYGGAHKGKSLSQGAKLLQERAFSPIGGAHLPAPHAYTNQKKNALTRERIETVSAFLRGEIAATPLEIAERTPNTAVQKQMKPLTGVCRVRAKKCVSCGKCREVCPVSAVGSEFRAGKSCILCGSCVSACPVGARSLSLTPFTTLFLRLNCKERKDEFFRFTR